MKIILCKNGTIINCDSACWFGITRISMDRELYVYVQFSHGFTEVKKIETKEEGKKRFKKD